MPYIRVRFKFKVVLMNKILVLNGMLLLSLMGISQCIDVREVSAITKFQWSIYPFIGIWAYNQITYFVFAAFVAPLIAVALSKKLRLNRVRVSSLMIVNPLLFFVVAFSSQPPIEHYESSMEHLLGPSKIVKLNEKRAASPSILQSANALTLYVFQLATQKEDGS